MTNDFDRYSAAYISGVMSLRKPQAESLAIIEDILTDVKLKKDLDLDTALATVHAKYPAYTDFERHFMSLAFALATGVGKTRLMGAFIAWLYTQRDIKNFFIVAPGTTVYNKLRQDLGEPGSSKYVFKGLGCFTTPPQIITGDDYKYNQSSLFSSDVRLFIFNIDKFNKENANMRKIDECLGGAFFDMLAALPDLVLIMDESHHYRAKRGAATLDGLKPILGLELTATPFAVNGNRHIQFKNVVYDYTLRQAIADGYVRTPYAITRSDIKCMSFDDKDTEIDEMMLEDGATRHEMAKRALLKYALDRGRPKVRPFMFVVCRDTEHATAVEKYVTSDNFRHGVYKNKTITVHSKLSTEEGEANTQLLQYIERPDSQIEIVIHVNMLKEGWDVNNLYTIVPLRTAASKILREQMVGRGLRLPYGERTGDKDVDSVMLTAHDKFDELMREAQSGDSIFRTENIIDIRSAAPKHLTTAKVAIKDFDAEDMERAITCFGLERTAPTERFVRVVDNEARCLLFEKLNSVQPYGAGPEQMEEIKACIAARIAENKDFGSLYTESKNAIDTHIDKNKNEIAQCCIPIPQVKIVEAEDVDGCRIEDFKLDLAGFSHAPIMNKIVVQNIVDIHDRDSTEINNENKKYECANPEHVLLDVLRDKPIIDYESNSELLFKLVKQACGHYEESHGREGMKNIIAMHKQDIADKICKQAGRHICNASRAVREEVAGVRECNVAPNYMYEYEKDMNEGCKGDTITSVLFRGFRKSVFDCAKFDSVPELMFARLLEGDSDVLKWLRPAPAEFNIKYNGGRSYEPDFVVETEDAVWLVEIKAEKDMENADVIAKKISAVKYCQLVSEWCKNNGRKEWRHLFIPAEQVQLSSTFKYLSTTYSAMKELQ